MKLTNLLNLLICFLMIGCATIRPERILLNREKGIYEYKVNRKNSITLRNEFHQLVDTANYELFKVELHKLKNRYPFKKRLERDQLLKQSDFELSKQYGMINQSLIEGDYQKSMAGLNILPSIYSDIYSYSDWYYLKGFAFENLGLADSARIMYDHFLTCSSQKFTSRFRGHRDDDVNDSIYIAERKYANNYLQHQENTHSVKFSPIKPKYYFGSIQPGYSLNDEDMTRNSRGILMLVLGTDVNGDFSSGLQYYYKINERFNLNPRYSTSGNITEFSLGAPIQLYKSENNQFGLKFTPFLNYLRIDSLTIDKQQYLIDESFMNFGARISAGYYFYPDLAIGAYYQTNFYNEKNRFQSKKSQTELWIKDDYDVSLYYNIYKGFSLKSGVRNGDLVTGFMWSCWEISYNISNPGMIFRIDMY